MQRDAYYAHDLAPLMREEILRWGEEHPEVILLDEEIRSLSRHLAAAILKRYAIPRLDPLYHRKHKYPRDRRPAAPTPEPGGRLPDGRGRHSTG